MRKQRDAITKGIKEVKNHYKVKYDNPPYPPFTAGSGSRLTILLCPACFFVTHGFLPSPSMSGRRASLHLRNALVFNPFGFQHFPQRLDANIMPAIRESISAYKRNQASS